MLYRCFEQLLDLDQFQRSARKKRRYLSQPTRARDLKRSPSLVECARLAQVLVMPVQADVSSGGPEDGILYFHTQEAHWTSVNQAWHQVVCPRPPDQKVEAVLSAASHDLLLMAVADFLGGLIRARDSRAAREVPAQPRLWSFLDQNYR
jgi:hypothetical protein